MTGTIDVATTTDGPAQAAALRRVTAAIATIEDAALQDALARHFPGALRARHTGQARSGQELSGSEIVAAFLEYVGVDVVFGIPGGASLPLSDALTAGCQRGVFRYVLTGHEQGAAFEAEGW
jgi:hypothetical protein